MAAGGVQSTSDSGTSFDCVAAAKARARGTQRSVSSPRNASGSLIAGGAEVVLDAEVNFHLGVFEPAAPARRGRGGLRDFSEAQQLSVESAGRRLASRGMASWT
jgi:hypothetical protein